MSNNKPFDSPIDKQKTIFIHVTNIARMNPDHPITVLFKYFCSFFFLRRFPNIVTADNISYTRFSRNKAISRVMTEFEWVRELNEGVKKIYSDMADVGLPAPEYIETSNTVKLILRNNIDERTAHRNKASNEALNNVLNPAMSELMSESVSESMTELERARMQIILNYLDANKEINSSIAAKLLEVKVKTASRLLSKAEKLDILKGVGKTKNKVYFRG